jgi:hypothetical protein
MACNEISDVSAWDEMYRRASGAGTKIKKNMHDKMKKTSRVTSFWPLIAVTFLGRNTERHDENGIDRHYSCSEAFSNSQLLFVMTCQKLSKA